MGLDQYLYRKNDKGVEVEEIYWRKANFVHKYFTHDWMERGFEGDDCVPFPTTREELSQLAALCDEVLETPHLAPHLLPTMSGFFFGSTNYDEWYFKDVKFTRDEIRRLLNESTDEDFYYEAWY